jgi:hypothetical protein
MPTMMYVHIGSPDPSLRIHTYAAGVLVPEDFVVPRELRTDWCRLVPLGPEYNEADYAAWMSSITHLQRTPGFEEHGWPPDGGIPIDENRADLVRHADEFAKRIAFAYTVLRLDADEVIGCVYLNPPDDPAAPADAVDVRSWVRADIADRDTELRAVVRDWLASTWPFTTVRYAD